MGRPDIRCEHARSLLPEFAGEGEPYPPELEAHLATCDECAAEEARYRGTLRAMASLEATEPLPPGFAQGVVARLARSDLRAWAAARRMARDPRTRYAAASLGGAVVGAAAVALLIRRAAVRRPAVA